MMTSSIGEELKELLRNHHYHLYYTRQRMVNVLFFYVDVIIRVVKPTSMSTADFSFLIDTLLILNAENDATYNQLTGTLIILL